MIPLPLWPGDSGRAAAQPGEFATLAHYRPSAIRDLGASMLVLPGGGYGGLADHEGHDFALWLAQRGIAAGVLNYRLGSAGHHHPAMLQDAARALRVLRARARSEGRDPLRVGVMGSSAGGHLGASLTTLHAHAHAADSLNDAISAESARPDVAVLCYPVITMQTPHTHLGSRENLLGPPPASALVDLLSTELQVTPDHPPAFLWHTTDDAVVDVENPLLYAAALRRARVSFAIHVFAHGEHGLGLGHADKPAPPWSACLEHWLRERGWISA
ncbi:MAG: alpha/beta hydrolase [Burkholderiales bacterium]|nr:alpha/beta hydrolase [Opitutaceae bacterium]